MAVGDFLSDLAQILLPVGKARARLRAAWGQPGNGDGFLSGLYFDRVRRRCLPAQLVDDRTWDDLEFARIFQDIDTTITPVGRQCLYRKLRTLQFDGGTIDRQWTSYQTLQSNRELRENLQFALLPLDRASAPWIVDLLAGTLPEKSPIHDFALPLVLLSVLAVATAAVHLVTPWLPVVMLLINAVIAIRIDPTLGRSADAMLDCGQLLSVARKLETVCGKETIPELDRIIEGVPTRKHLASQIKVLSWWNTLSQTVPFGGIVVLANLLLLAKLLFYVRAKERFISSRELWLSLYDQIGSVDAAIAVSNFIHRHPAHSRPIVTEEPTIRLIDAYHPLISEPVKNSILLRNRSALITGSNMTGKTTFIKMIAINIILGHTLGICLAAEATVPRSGVMSVIKGGQSVEAGKSRYFAEAEAIREFLQESAAGACRVFVIDEPFSGTNTVERIAATRSVLAQIGSHAQVLATTHDVELQHLLEENFSALHFREDPAVEGFYDHRVYAGVSHERNAIRVLERLGYPSEIIAAALATVAQIDQ